MEVGVKMKERILEILDNANSALSYEEIDNLLGLKTSEEYAELKSIVDELTSEDILYRSNKNKFMLFKRNQYLRKGTLGVNPKGFGFVKVGEGEKDIYIDSTNLNGAIHNDEVVVEIIPTKEADHRDGRVLRVTKREIENLVGELYYKDNIAYIKLDDPKVKLTIIIDNNKLNGAVEGHKVVVKTIKNLGSNKYTGEVVRILGHKNDPGVDILSVVHKYNINDTFSEEVMAEVALIPTEVSADEIEARHDHDLRDNMIFTIDGDDAKDIDDAVSIKVLPNGNYLLGVHIADVSYYVQEGSAIDNEAYDRGTSVYLADRVIPMLPHALSNGICSLNEGVDRLAMTCEMEINHNGTVVKYDIYPSVIHSKKRMTYKAVNQILEQSQVVPGYEPFIADLRAMGELAKILRKNKENRGYIDFDTEEVKIIVDATGKPIEIKKRERGTGENLIEDFMIAANETVAGYIYYMDSDLPFIYRIHEEPSPEKIQAFLQLIAVLGYNIPGNPRDFNPKTLQRILHFLHDKPEYKMLADQALRSMQKAIYLPENRGHYGLASECYTHFTSPIRRYPDQTIHRLIRIIDFLNDRSEETMNHWLQKLPALCEHSSLKERNSVECEREVDDMKMAEYMLDHIGEEYEGKISSVMQFGLFVMLENLIEGLIRIDEIKGDYYQFDERTYSLIGQRTKKRYQIGNKVKVKVKAASKELRRIDFELIK
jgi:ribonuclease R